MPLVPPKKTVFVNGKSYQAGQEYPEVKPVEKKKSKLKKTETTEVTDGR